MTEGRRNDGGGGQPQNQETIFVNESEKGVDRNEWVPRYVCRTH